MIIDSYRYAVTAATLFLDETGLGSAAAAWSTARKLRSAYAGSCIRVRRSSDSTEQDIGFTDDELDTASLASFCSGTDGFLVTIYDQSGNARNITQATASQQPQIVSSGTIFTGANGKPSCRFDGTGDSMNLSFTQAQPWTWFAVFNQNTWTAGDGLISGYTSGGLWQDGTTPNLILFTGSASTRFATFSVATWYIGTFVVNSSSSTARANDGTETSGLNPGTGTSGGVTLGKRSNADGTFFGNLYFQELVMYGAAKDATDQTTARNNLNAFYATY